MDKIFIEIPWTIMRVELKALSKWKFNSVKNNRVIVSELNAKLAEIQKQLTSVANHLQQYDIIRKMDEALKKKKKPDPKNRSGGGSVDRGKPDSKSWNRSAIDNIFNEEDMIAIMAVSINLTDTPDQRTSSVWTILNLVSFVPSPNIVLTFQWFSEISSSSSSRSSSLQLILVVSWFIWKARNRFTFEGTLPVESLVLFQMLHLTTNLSSANEESLAPPLTANYSPSIWSPPPRDWLKFKCDSGFDSGTSLCCVAGILRETMPGGF
ncbi:hypothetical protein LguiB_010636 [Lonicera macranthoides]